VVLSCVDTPRARAYLATQTQFLRLPLIEAGFEGAHLHLSCYPVVNSQEAHTVPCWLCNHPEPAGAFSCRFYAAAAEAVGIIPAIQNGAATLAGLQAEAAIGVSHHTIPLAHRILRLDLRTGQAHVADLARDPLCQGGHQVLETAPEPLTTTSTEPLTCLLQELEERGGADVNIRLRSPYLNAGPCTRCSGWTAIHQPSWAWEMAPYCQACGGPFAPLVTQSANHSPEVEAHLSRVLTPHLLALPCRQVGFPPLALVWAEWPDQGLRIFRMPGTVDDLFETVSVVQA
jgi:ThiF family